MTVSVVATLEPTSFVYGTLLVDAHGLMLPLGDTEDTVLVAPAEGVSDRALVAALRRGFGRNEVLSADAWIDRTVAESVMNQRASIATIIGGATVLALANLAQVTLAAVRERRDEAGLLLRLGASRRTVIATSVLEVVSMISVAALLAVGVTVAVITHLGAALDQAAPGLAPAVPLSILVGVLLACALVAVGTAAAGARWMTVRMSIDSE